MTNIVEHAIIIAAPIERVWSALTEVGQFNAWFGVALGQPFVPGQPSSGPIGAINAAEAGGRGTLEMTIWVEAMEAPRLFSFRWHPFAIEAGRDYSHEPKTLVEFRLEAIDGGTRLTVRESGFEALPAERIDPAWRANDNGWRIQADRIKAFVDG